MLKGITGREIRFTFPSQPGELRGVRERVRACARANGFNDSEIFEIEVAVGEATANAIEHGDGSPVAVVCDPSNTSLIITVTSSGPFKKRLPSIGEEEDFRGRGILLMLALMDRVTIDEFPERVTVTLTKLAPRV